MKHHTWRIAGDVPSFIRGQLLATVAPRFPNLYLKTLTWADRVPDSYNFDSDMQDCTIYALHTGPTTQAFLVNLGGQLTNPDGRRLVITFCTADGIKPMEAWQIDTTNVVRLPDPVTFGIELRKQPMWQSTPKRVHAVA